ncbi:hypothetical protein LSH36_2g18026 [Paralvinella palmiformis]|uniref:Uncharacterized protein n=1 Tax=Paralvinella palmiformis TaxID=53620 RepID=A0AAD9KGB4_9ANNE|nr:hypothetical protein LSH36_2g18026 [Paralvinella palmiformis]
MAEVLVARPVNKTRKCGFVYITLLVLGLLFVIIGVILLFELKSIVHSDISKKIPIVNGSETYNDWVEPPVPVYMTFWVFDLVNADDFVNNGAKPILKEKGPYTYREYRPKEDIVFSKNDTLVSYREPKTYVFIPDMSVGKENDTFTTVNFPLLPTGNGSNDGVYTVYTGQENLTLYNEIYQWQNKSSLNYWTTPYCNMINGSVIRSLYVTFSKEETIKGITMYRFSPPPSVMQEPAENPDNIGFCTPDCLKSGVLNISTCRQGAPVIISQPHFYEGDESFVNAFEGLSPDAAKHATILDVEPVSKLFLKYDYIGLNSQLTIYTGAALNAAKKLQLNFYIRKLTTLVDTQHLQNNTVFPVVWLSESAEITDSQASEFKHKVIVPTQLSIILPWVIIAVGCLLIVIGLAILIYLLISADQSKQVCINMK